jgi:Protein of unknown function (DUF3500)
MRSAIFIVLLSFGIFLPWKKASTMDRLPDYMDLAVQFLNTLTPDQKNVTCSSFQDTLRFNWVRLPGQRKGLKLSYLNEGQKIVFHELLRKCLSTSGYLKVTSIMFNEDIQQKKEKYLGRNEFWVEFFGVPGVENSWGWKLEGHHLSLNFTFQGNTMISNSPFLMGTNPSNSTTDSVRAGLVILFKEEELGRELVNTVTEEQLKSGYTSQKKPKIVYSEQNK